MHHAREVDERTMMHYIAMADWTFGRRDIQRFDSLNHGRGKKE